MIPVYACWLNSQQLSLSLSKGFYSGVINYRITLVKASGLDSEETNSVEAESSCRCEAEDEIEDASWKQSVQGFENQAEGSGLHLWKRDPEGFLIGRDKCKASF